MPQQSTASGEKLDAAAPACEPVHAVDALPAHAINQPHDNADNDVGTEADHVLETAADTVLGEEPNVKPSPASPEDRPIAALEND